MVAASAASLVHPLSEVVDNSVEGGVREGVVPWGGTRSEFLARRAGGIEGLATSRALSTGEIPEAAEMIVHACLPVSTHRPVVAVGR